MEKFFVFFIIGVAIGSVYAISATGLVVTYITSGVFNFAHGAIGMLGAFAFWQLHVEWGLPTWLALAIVLFVLAPLVGLVVESGIMRKLQGATEATQIVVTVALLAAALGLGQWVWPPEDAHPLDHFWQGNTISIGGVNVSWHSVFTFVVAIAVALGLRILLYNTRAGVTMRATVDDRGLARLNGARVDRSAMLAWAIGCGLAALGGILIAPDQTLQHQLLTLLVVNAYAAAVIGRLRSLPLTFVGAIALGLADSFVNSYVRITHRSLAGLRPAVPVLLLFAVLLLLPHSRLRGHRAARSHERFPQWTWSSAIAAAAALVLVTAAIATLLTDADARTAMKLFGLAIVALSLVPLVGYAGQISLCQMSFAGIGAVVMAHQGTRGNPLALVLVALVCAVVGAIVALPALRLSGIYLALATGAFAVILDRWLFLIPSQSVFGHELLIFESGITTVDRLRIPGVDPSSAKAELVVLAAVFALLSLVVVAVRRGAFGERLLALKDSPAACATLGINVRTTKLQVFALSAAIAGVGGAIYGGALGSISADRFSFFESLPLLLLAVVGGIGTPIGALLGSLTLFLIPVFASTFSWFANPARVLPGTIGLSLARSPNGVAAELGDRLAPLGRNRRALAAARVGVVVLYGLELGSVINGWVFAVLAFVAPFVAARLADRGPRERHTTDDDLDLEWRGLSAPYDATVLARIDAELDLPVVR